MKDILPCKYCRASTTEFVHAHPLRGDPGKWLYDIHNMVNHKLREQSKEDKTVRDPGRNPSFAEVKEKYENMKPNAVPGRDFLFALAYNYPDKPEEADMCTQRSFLHHLAISYPFLRMARVFQAYLKKYEPTLSSRKVYLHWMYGLLKQLSEFAKVDIPTFRGYAHHVAYYKSGCNKKTYHGKTCRKLAGGGLTKSRDHRKTYRVAHRSLL
jgi:hypothetical protein